MRTSIDGVYRPTAATMSYSYIVLAAIFGCCTVLAAATAVAAVGAVVMWGMGVGALGFVLGSSN
jgi:hypothetical protein